MVPGRRVGGGDSVEEIGRNSVGSIGVRDRERYRWG